MTTASILAHAPSSTIARRAELLAFPIFFEALSQHDLTFYGEIAQADGTRCRVHFAPSQKHFACSCNMRQQPCFHALALAILRVNHAESFAEGVIENPILPHTNLHHQAPTSLLSNAEQALADKQQRRMHRLERAVAGFEDLSAWMDDVIRRGLGTVHQESPKFADHIAARMADASLEGIARKLRLFQAQALSGDTWTQTVLTTLSELKTVAAIFAKRAEISDGLFADLMDYCGIKMRKEDVLAEGESITDIWTVLGIKEELLEDRLEMRRTWLLGQQSQRFALILDFGFGSGGLPPGFEFGQQIKADAVFYPSAVPLRILMRTVHETTLQHVHTLPMILATVTSQHWTEVQEAFARSLALCPWQYSTLALVSDIIIRSNNDEDQFYLIDNKGAAAIAKINHDVYMKLLSFSRGRSFLIAGEWNAINFTPIAAFGENGMMQLV